MSNYYYEMCAVRNFLYVYHRVLLNVQQRNFNLFLLRFFSSIYFRKIIRIVFCLMDVQKEEKTNWEKPRNVNMII